MTVPPWRDERILARCRGGQLAPVPWRLALHGTLMCADLRIDTGSSELTPAPPVWSLLSGVLVLTAVRLTGSWRRNYSVTVGSNLGAEGRFRTDLHVESAHRRSCLAWLWRRTSRNTASQLRPSRSAWTSGNVATRSKVRRGLPPSAATLCRPDGKDKVGRAGT